LRDRAEQETASEGFSYLFARCCHHMTRLEMENGQLGFAL
jgi:hypothetical protein